MDSDIKLSPEELQEAKRSLEVWRKSYNDETTKLMKELTSKSGGTRRNRKNKSRKSHKRR